MVSTSVRLCWLLLLVGLVVALPGLTVAGHTAPAAASVSQEVGPVPHTGVVSAAAAGPPQPANNSTVRHEDLDKLSDGPAPAVQQWFERYLSSQLETSVVTLEQGEYDRARSVLGESYTDQLAKYVDVVGETDATEDDQTASAFERARDQQAEYADAVEEYRQTYQEYQAAKRNGNETRARTLARELNRLDTRIQHTSANLTASYTTIGNTSETNLTTAHDTVRRITANISTQQTEIRRATFTNTSIEIDHHSSSASFREPLKVRGRLVAANGTALADRRLIVALGNQTVRTRTTANGTFDVTVRPALVKTGTQTATLQYRPRPSAAFLGTNTTVPVTINQVTPTVTLSDTPDSVGFTETVAVEGRIHAANVSAAGVPVRVFIGETALGTARTAANGTFRFTTPLPAHIPAGDRQLRVALAHDNRALGPASTTAPVTVPTTASTLRVDQTLVNETQAAPQVRVAGTLTTSSGTPVPTAPVEVRVGNQSLTTVATNRTGGYVTTISAGTLLAAVGPDTETATITVVYPGNGNVAPARAQTTVSVAALAAAAGDGGTGGAGPGTTTGGLRGVSPWLWAVGLLVLALVGGVALRYVRGRGPATDTATAAAPGGDDESAADTTLSAVSTDVSQTVRKRATAHLETGQPDSAVMAAYMAVREHTVEALGWDAQQTAPQTYWEFYRRCHDHEAITAAQRTALETLTEHYERARFTPTSTPDDQAADAVGAATDFLAAFESPVAPEPDDAVADSDV